MRNFSAGAGRPKTPSLQWLTDTRGVVAIEFAFLALPMIAIVIAILQVAVVFLAQTELETAVERTARQLLTGQAQQASTSREQFTTTLCSYLQGFFGCSGLMVDLQVASAFASADTSSPTLTYDAAGNVANAWNFSTGATGSILVLRVFYQFPLVGGPMGLNLANLPNGKHLMQATMVLQVEPYSAGAE